MADLRNTRASIAARNAGADAIVALADGGRVRLYTGAQPAAGGAAVGTMLWESDPLPTPAFGAAANGECDLLAPESAVVLVTGVPTWYRVVDAADGILWDGSVGDDTDGDQHNLEIDDPNFVAGGTFILNSLTFDIKAQGI